MRDFCQASTSYAVSAESRRGFWRPRSVRRCGHKRRHISGRRECRDGATRQDPSIKPNRHPRLDKNARDGNPVPRPLARKTGLIRVVDTTDHVRAIFGARLKSLPKIGFCGVRSVIDLHCHLLPGLDDGAPNLQTALMMARAAVDQGVTYVAD
jgi:hypothetical protein